MTDHPAATDSLSATCSPVPASGATLDLSSCARPAFTYADDAPGEGRTGVGGCGGDPVDGQSIGSLAGQTPPATDCAVGARTDDPQVQDLRGEVERLRSTLTELRGELDAARQAHHDDIAAIGRALLREAEDRDWCDDYDQVIDDLNGQLSVALPERVRAWDVTFDLRVTVHIPNARNADDARERAAELAADIEDAVQALPHVTAADAEGGDDFSVTEA